MIRDQLVTALREALVALDVQPLPDVINLERPARREHGDWSTNVALASAKKAGRNPREEQRRGRCERDENACEQQPAGEKARHQRGLEMLNESAFHKTGGRRIDGTTPRSRRLCA